MGQMNADLVGPSGFQPAVHQRDDGRLAKALLYTRAGHRVAAPGEGDRLTLTVGAVAVDTGHDAQNAPRLKSHAPDTPEPGIGGVGNTMNQRAVMPVDGMGLELPGKAVMGTVGLGDDEQAGGFLVDPVNDARPPRPPDAGEAVAAMVEQRVHQRPRSGAGCGVDDHARGLVHHDQVIVLPDHHKGDRLRQRFQLLGRVEQDGDLITRRHTGRDIGQRLLPAPHGAGGNEPRKAGA